jgi:hypothetical protein
VDIVRRLGSILLKPKEEWVKIKAEQTTFAKLFVTYAMILAVIPPIFEFLRRVLIDRIPMQGHWPVGRSLGLALFSFSINLAQVLLLAVIIDGLARSFSSTKNLTNALKLAAYSMTPVWVIGVFNIFSGFWVPGVVASLYGFFILYLGFDTPMMETPKDRVLGYMVLSGVAAAVLSIVGGGAKMIFAVRYGRL